jgi:DNA repair photolyase
MAKRNLKITDARRSKVLVKSTFKGYDLCINTYVGCQFGCKYCYVRFFIKDKEMPWGEFVRQRSYIEDKLPKELPKAAGKRIVFGTMTDPYQPVERKARITRTALEILRDAEGPPNKVGLFTRSPIVLEDAEIIAALPRARVHFSITPFDRRTMKRIEGIPIQTKRRWDTIRKLKEAGIRTHVNVAPAIPILSDGFIDEYCEQLAACKVDEFFVDPMQTYKQAFEALAEAMEDHPDWPKIHAIMTSKERFQEWKDEFRDKWIAAWKRTGNKDALPMWCDHIKKVWTNMNTGEDLDPTRYGDDLEDYEPPEQKTA